MLKYLSKKISMLIAVCLVYYAMTWYTGCPIKFVTGISCPGCGMTRAWIALAHLNLQQAFSCHPLFILAPLFIIFFIFDDKIDLQKYRWIILLVAFLFIGVYLIRIIRYPDAIVSFSPRSGILYKIGNRILPSVFH